MSLGYTMYPKENDKEFTKMNIRYVTQEDWAFWYSLDKHLPESEFDNKVRDRQD